MQAYHTPKCRFASRANKIIYRLYIKVKFLRICLCALCKISSLITPFREIYTQEKRFPFKTPEHYIRCAYFILYIDDGCTSIVHKHPNNTPVHCWFVNYACKPKNTHKYPSSLTLNSFTFIYFICFMQIEKFEFIIIAWCGNLQSYAGVICVVDQHMINVYAYSPWDTILYSWRLSDYKA